MRANPPVDYHALYQAFRRHADWNDGEAISFDGGAIYNPLFVSRNAAHLLGHPRYLCGPHDVSFEGEGLEEAAPDCEIPQNIRFRYPLICRSQAAPAHRHRRVTFLLHGLNERAFSKYLPWAYEFCAANGAPVLLFPLALHMNRVLPAWAGGLTSICDERRRIPYNQFAHRFNAIMSQRLEQRPERFFWGAVQSYLDLVDLAREIRAGRHPYFAQDARIDLVGYSAGGYVALLLLLEDPEGFFADSRAALFASCAPARDLSLASPLILDLAAETALMRMFVKNLDQRASPRMRHWFEWHGEGRWFRAICGIRTDRQKLEARLKQFAPRLLGVANTNDDVMPLNSILARSSTSNRPAEIRALA